MRIHVLTDTPPSPGVLRPALALLLLFTLLTGVVYPLVVTGLARVAFPVQAGGSLIERNGQVVGSALLGQRFQAAQYFQGRPSGAGAEGYDAAASSGSNYGPTSKALLERVAGDVERLRKEQPGQQVPADLATASGSGLDPHISPAAAEYQVARVAAARKLPEDRVRQLVREHTQGRDLGFLGDPAVNVLQLNLALDALSPPPDGSAPAALP
ncbi:potassium-transporting ATPase subunit KdpC [Solimonas sp. K1W22B-7]|uniref:potassium-transporting ATPase subunit KdpC n=1 Tax=Solimonas sp. K1W22B-7 TaxID=2303331 RepID=UPI000E33726B|nr:potassium-transporting ATPase subunit KdpC [Solimonas sp. K1W22B-7]AXQ29530.1 potassium-transporting ATPase subunit KdpC [Solimonas sp. K1W22B-7]